MHPSEIPVVILCGGEGTRLREETGNRPKPLVEVGPEPILLHIMRIYARYGFRRFVLCLGYRGMMIKEFFLSRDVRSRDLRLELKTGNRSFLGDTAEMDWEVTFAETGERNQTGSRIAQIAEYIDTPHFMATYGDGVSDIDLHALLGFHLAHGGIGTVTGVSVDSQFGELKTAGDTVTAFAEKPKNKAMINGGFFVFSREFFRYLSRDPSCVLEREPLDHLARDGGLKMYRHEGFWRCMDTFKDYQLMNELYAGGNAPWIPCPEPVDHVTAA